MKEFPRGTFTKVLKGRDSVAGAQSAKSGHQDSLLFIRVVLSSPRLGSAFRNLGLSSLRASEVLSSVGNSGEVWAGSEPVYLSLWEFPALCGLSVNNFYPKTLELVKGQSSLLPSPGY